MTESKLGLILEIAQHLTLQRISQLRDAARFIEDAIAERVTQAGVGLDAFNQAAPGEAYDQWEDLVEQIEQLQGTFAQGLRKALFTSAWSALESDLERLANVFAASCGLKLRVHDLSGRGVQRSHKYFDRVAGLDLTAATTEWDDIVRLNSIRNVIIHTDSEIRNNDRLLYAFIDRWPSITVQEKYVLVDERFLPEVLRTTERYWVAVFSAGHRVEMSS